MPASGHEFMCGPLSVEYMTIVLSAIPSASSSSSTWPDDLVVVEHRVVVRRLPAAGPPEVLVAGVRAEVHVRRVEPDEERGVGLVLAAHEVDRRVAELLVAGLHPLDRERAGVLDPLRPVAVRPRPDDAARAEPLAEVRELLVGRVVGMLRLLLGVEVVEVAEELVEAVHRRQELVAVAEVVLAELAGGVALLLERRRDRRVLGAQADVGTGEAHLRQPGPVRVLAGDERRTAGGAALLAVCVGEPGALVRDPIDVRGPVSHEAVAVTAQVRDPDVIAPDDQDVRLVSHGTSDSIRSREPAAASYPPWGEPPSPVLGDHPIRA